MAHIPWDAKYRPRKIEDFIFQNEAHAAKLKEYVAAGSIPHLILRGHRGTGKTSLAYLLKSLLNIDDMDFLFIPASEENNVETVRVKIKSFVSTYASSNFKIVFLDEADLLSSSAQNSLRSMMETYVENARFILTCNHPHKLVPELRSRCTEYGFNALDKTEMLRAIVKILQAEKVPVGDPELDLLDCDGGYIESCYPDMRKLISTVENGVLGGKLQPFAEEMTSTDEISVTLLEFMESDDWDKMREYACANVSEDQWDDIYRFLYKHLAAAGKFQSDTNKWKAGIIVIADFMYRNAFVADREINFAACIIKLSQI